MDGQKFAANVRLNSEWNRYVWPFRLEFAQNYCVGERRRRRNDSFGPILRHCFGGNQERDDTIVK
jgi:hypothetical protein